MTLPLPSHENPVNNYSEIGQDKFVYDILKGKTGGTFLEIGAHDYIISSNTYRLEKEYNWFGIGVELNPDFKEGWLKNRTNSKFILTDAKTLDYGKLFQEHNMPKIIDYVSIDIDPPVNTLAALIQLLKTSKEYRFNVITFETDYYKDPNIREPSREIIKNAGYVLIKPGVCSYLGEQDDFYIHKTMIEK